MSNTSSSTPKKNADSTEAAELKRGSVGGQNSRDQGKAEAGAKGTRGGGADDAQPADAPARASTPREQDQHERRGPGDGRNNFEQPYVQKNLRGGEREGATSQTKSEKKEAPGPASHQ